ncbi:hypothetical protein B296_00011686 [Ensete ventricosum]|uniref:Thioredoxin domain-containing protein n=1 Tax=Ensete ventricosum TaxID=4639 RepID=A0A427B9J0_ENSVE|nr:hypothetical protein B296_00011686 [Ensete ventricosum]
MKLFMHGVPVDYTGPRKAELLVRFLKKFVSPDVSLLETDSVIQNFVEMVGTDFPVFIGFGLNESVILDGARKYKKKAWFSVAKDYSEEMMVAYDFDKVPALVSLHPKYKEQSVFYGPFEGDFLEDFIRQNLLPPTVPIRFETLKLMNDDKRKIVLAIMEDELDEKSLKLVKILRSAATANRDLIFGYVGVKQWGEFVDAFDITKSSKLPKLLVWDGNEEYHTVKEYLSTHLICLDILFSGFKFHHVIDLEDLDDNDQGTQISRFLEGYRGGRTIKRKLSSPSPFDFISSLTSIRTVYLIVFVVAVVMVILLLSTRSADTPQVTQDGAEVTEASVSQDKSSSSYRPGDKED